MDEHNFKALYLFCGIGGGALGFQQAEEEYKGIKGSFETICGIDCDPDICKDFEYITGSRAECMDLFSREQYISFHGKEPAADWKEVTPEDIRKACRGKYPDVVFTSPPCKGFSGLLPEKSAKSEKYQALNKLTIRGIKLICEAFKDSPPSLILLENVPRITTRGKGLLDEIKKVLKEYGYAFSDGYHDCGEIGGLAQHRKRYLLICRNTKKLQGFVYQPPIRRVKAIGEVLQMLPIPGADTMGSMHRIPKLQWKTWVRLALIPAGGDWRDLEKKCYANVYQVVPWEEPSGTVTGAHRPNNGALSVADVRFNNDTPKFNHAYKITKWKETPGVVSSGTGPGAGATMVADPRLNERKKRYHGLYKVIPWQEPTSTIIGQTDLQCGALSIQDPRIKGNPRSGTYGVVKWDEPVKTVIGKSDVNHNGAAAVQDPRFTCKQRSGTMGIMDWDEPAKTITSADVNSGATAVADPRTPKWRNGWKCTGAVGKVNEWDKPVDTILGHSSARGNGASNVADPRIPKETENGVWVIISEDNTWHRPLTTLELAVLQGLPVMINGEPLKLTGKSDSAWRERIGNMVPVQAAEAIANVMLRAMLPQLKDEIVLGWTPIWVVPQRPMNI